MNSISLDECVCVYCGSPLDPSLLLALRKKKRRKYIVFSNLQL